MANVS